MADFAAVLRKTIASLESDTPEMREKVFDKARAAIESKLAAITPPPPAVVADRQRKALEDAIATIRAEYAEPEPDDFEDFLGVFDEDEAPEQAVSESTTAVPASMAQTPSSFSAEDSVEDGEAGDDDERGETSFGAAPEIASSDFQRKPAPLVGTAGGAASPTASPSLKTQTPRRPAKRGGRTGILVAASIAVLVVAGAAVAFWAGGDRISAMFGGAAPVQVSAEDPAAPEAEVAEAAVEEPAELEAAPTAAEAAADDAEKFTQRLLPDGREVDEGPAGEQRRIGEGTSVATATGPSDTPPASAGAAADSQLRVGHRAIFYEQSTTSAEGSAEPGSIVWSLVRESPGGDAAPEPAIRAEVTIPGHALQLRMTIRRNADRTLPAGHIVELIFLTPENFAGGAIDNVLRVAMKGTEEETGMPLIGIPAKIADGFFLFALSEAESEMAVNLDLMRTQSWIDIPIMYRSGRRALMTVEKGLSGERVFDEAIEAWGQADSG